MDTAQKWQESCNYINLIKCAELLQVLHLKTLEDKEFYLFIIVFIVGQSAA